MTKLASALICAGLLTAHVSVLHAAVTADEAKKLGAELTAVGAEKAGNKEGTIPAYTGGLTTPPANFDKSKNVRPDPFANEKPQFSIDAKNMDKYADKLSEGTKALMKAYAGYRIDVYPTHRTAAYPKFVQDNTVKLATKARMGADGGSVLDASAGIPFPIPKTGAEVMMNAQLRFLGTTFWLPKYSAFNVDSAGKVSVASQGSYRLESTYYNEAKAGVNVNSMLRVDYSAPTRRNGEGLLLIEPYDFTSKGRKGWQYLPGQRRVRLAPDVSYDTPNSSTAGMSTYDDSNVFNGQLDRYDWKLVGKKELYVPYNTYRFSYNDKPESVLKPKFIDPDVLRWELHRVWVVEATLKEGKRHIYSRRTFYLDEDSWALLASDQYDGRGQLWRPGFAYLTQSYDVAVPTTQTSGHYDLNAGSYYVNLWPGPAGVSITDTRAPETFFTPDALAAQGVR